MQTIMTALTVAALVLAPGAAFAECTPTTTQHSDAWGSGADDPNIPNCVMNPQHGYEGGTCERVTMWLSLGNNEEDQNCRLDAQQLPP